MNSQEVLQLIGLTKARYQAKFQHNPAIEEVWNMVLDDVPFDPAKSALAHWIKTEDWPPDPATDIRQAVLDAQSPLPTANQAWAMVQQRIKDTYFPEKAPKWDVPKEVDEAARKVGGLRAIRLSEKPDEMRRRFEKAYTDLRHGRENVTAIGPNVMKELLG